MSVYVLSKEDAERVTSVLGPFSKLESAQEYAQKDHGSQPLVWDQADPEIFFYETWMSGDEPEGYYTVEKFEMDPEWKEDLT